MTKPTTTLFDSRSNAIPSKISNDLLAGKVVLPEDCPWVQVGNLYLSVTITGNESWLPLLARLYQRGHREISVFSGRHGDVPNIVDSEGWTRGVFDAEHIREDEKVKQKALGEFKDITIEIIDTRAGEKEQKQWLIENATPCLQINTPVIFGWCYSLFTMFEFRSKAPGGTLTTPEITARTKAQADEIRKPISEIVTTNFGWAMIGGSRSARRPGGSIAAPQKTSSQSGEALVAVTKAPTDFADKAAL